MNSVYYNDIQQQQPFYDESQLKKDDDIYIEQQEEDYFAHYEQVMDIEADRFDYYYNEQCSDDYEALQIKEDMEMEEEEEQDMTYHIEDDALLKLVVDVQSYITDLASIGVDRHDSPLMDLQYKMYTYLKQKALDMGMDTDALPHY
ncbi:hypothetical protein BJ944DRAFT_274196 [Cunninghamella echinulata]|nr:hypothetical protein BJ944DRAFT_274196 [Cunninghamella echinulata]